MALLFGEQQISNSQHDRVVYKAQEQSLNPCYKDYKNSEKLKSHENYYYFQLNEKFELIDFDEKPEPLYDAPENKNNNIDFRESQPAGKLNLKAMLNITRDEYTLQQSHSMALYHI